MNELETREKARRRALWKLQALKLGDPAAAEWLVVLAEVEFLDQLKPIGEGSALTIEQLRALVPITDVRGFRVVRDEDIPQPWRERFGEASTGSTRIPDGSYSRDWLKFLALWPKEMTYVQQHRNRHSSPGVSANDDRA